MASLERPRHLFVYGTLRPDVGHPMADRLRRHARAVGRGVMLGRLYDAGPYPAVVVDGEASDDARVHGHVFAMEPSAQDELLGSLDIYEGCPLPGSDPPLFVRTAVEVTLDDGRRVTAWVYAYARDVGGLDPVPTGDWAVHRRARTR